MQDADAIQMRAQEAILSRKIKKPLILLCFSTMLLCLQVIHKALKSYLRLKINI